MTESESIASISKELNEMLGDESAVVQREYEQWCDWMLTRGKNPRRKKGLSKQTVTNHVQRFDQLHRMVISNLSPEDLTRLTTVQADEIIRAIDKGEITQRQSGTEGNEYSEHSKRKFVNALQNYFNWQYHQKGTLDSEWEPAIKPQGDSENKAYRFTYREFGLILEEAKSYGSLPSYYSTSAEEREEIKGLVAQRLGIPKEEVTQQDWLEADWSQKVYSMIISGHDAGLTPIEVARAELSWFDLKGKTLHIPTDQACKKRKKNDVALSEQAAEALSEWLKERRHLSKYDDTNNIWLNRNGQPYDSSSLCRILRRLCKRAGISTENRKIVWYSLRRTMGINLTDEGALSEANDQLRHERLATTQEEYNVTPIERRQAGLDSVHQKSTRAKADAEYNPYAEETTSVSHTNGVQDQAETDKVVTPVEDNQVHVNAVIPDTADAKVDITSKLLNTDTTGQS